MSLTAFQLLLMLELPGQNVTPSRKLEIKPTVVHAGPSELLKLCPIESVLPQDKLDKIDYLLKIWFLAVNHAVTVVMEEIPVQLGIGTKEPELFLEIFTEITPTANHTS